MEAMRIKQGTSGNNPKYLLEFWRNYIMKRPKYQTISNEEKKSPFKPKQRDDGSVSILEQYEKLKSLY